MFVREDKSYPVIIPPTYNFSGDVQVAALLEAHLGPQGYRLQKVRLPKNCWRCAAVWHSMVRITSLM